ncbi:MAG: adenosylcobinamide amidohydrolase [Natronomonas sp.]
MFEAVVRDGILRLHREGSSWLSTGWNGGISRGAVAYNISVPEGWDRIDVEAYVAERRRRAGFNSEGPTLLTGVDLDHLRGARLGSVEVYATAGISNPAALPMDPETAGSPPGTGSADPPDPPGTVNVIAGTTRSIGTAALANLLSVVVEAKAATLLAETGYPGTTTDAAIVACDPTGADHEYTGTATTIGRAARACTRDAVLASLRSRYPDGEYPPSVESAAHGVSTDCAADVFTV